MSLTLQRIAGVLVLLAAGIVSLPVAAALFDGEGTENWIVPVQLLAMAAIGAGVCQVVPALAREGATRGRRALTGAWWGLLAAFAGVLVFFVLINGIRGA
jgi:hypothetical protein